MKKILLLFLVSITAFSQNHDRKFLKFKWNEKTLEIKTSDGTYFISPFSDNSVETSFIPTGESYDTISHAVVQNKKKDVLHLLETDNSLDLVSNVINIKIVKNPFQISYFNKSKLLFSEKNGYTKKDSTEVLDFNISSDEVLYGGGARALGMNRRGNRLQLYNRAHYGYETKAELMNFCIPMMLSSKLYAIHFDNPAIGYLDLDSKKNNTVSYETISGRKTYQVIAADSWTDLVKYYTDLTGKQPLPPRWAFGYFSSRFGYHSQEEVDKITKRFEDDKIPVDAIILDLYWFGKTIQGTMGNLDWDKDKFPNPNKMIGDLNAKGIKTILITEPFILTNSAKWKEVVDKKVVATTKDGKPATWDFYFGNTGIVDIFKPEGKQWFWNIYKNLINQGVKGLWGDLGEPEVFPSKAITAGGKADVVHNIYGHNWAKLIAEGYAKDFPTQRPFILMRAGYSGSQHYGMIPWSGDVNRSWGGLQSQTEIALQMGMQGIGYMHSDLGGFAGDYFDNELYLRWLQYGVFQPIFRPHAQEEVASEVVYKDVDTKAKAKKCVELRYQLMPYNYTLAYENSTKGTPLMRPLIFEEPNNLDIQKKSDGYLWGNNFLVYPITEKGQAEKEVYFPKTSDWYDFYSPKKYVAGTTATITTATDYIPTFVRAGSFIPMIKTIQNTTKYSLNNFDLHLYFDAKVTSSTGNLYNDDGETSNNIENGNYEILNFASAVKGKSLTVKLSSVVGKSFSQQNKNLIFTIHNITAKKILINGKSVSYRINGKNIEIPIIWEKGTNKEINIELF